mgnify:CR=1 FL=1
MKYVKLSGISESYLRKYALIFVVRHVNDN